MIDLEAIKRRVEAATPGPWHVRFLDDSSHMNLIGVATTPDTGNHECWTCNRDGWPDLVAATLVQQPGFVVPPDERWDENAEFIAHAREDVPLLISEVGVLRAQVSATAQELGKAWVDLEKAWDALKALRCRMLQDGPCWCEDGDQQWADWKHEAACVNARAALLGEKT